MWELPDPTASNCVNVLLRLLELSIVHQPFLLRPAETAWFALSTCRPVDPFEPVRLDRPGVSTCPTLRLLGGLVSSGGSEPHLQVLGTKGCLERKTCPSVEFESFGREGVRDEGERSCVDVVQVSGVRRTDPTALKPICL